MFKVLDTFAGAGGFSLGFQLAGCEVVGAIERDQWAADTFAFNHPHATVLVGDIESFKDDAIAKSFSRQKRPNIILGGPHARGSLSATRTLVMQKTPATPFSPSLSCRESFGGAESPRGGAAVSAGARKSASHGTAAGDRPRWRARLISPTPEVRIER
jgi:hypothetical protein